MLIDSVFYNHFRTQEETQCYEGGFSLYKKNPNIIALCCYKKRWNLKTRNLNQ